MKVRKEIADLLSEPVLQQMRLHALSSPDREVCGLVYGNRYAPLKNISADPNRFAAHPAELALLLAQWGEPLALFHTHPNGIPGPSEIDRTSYYKHHIIGVIDGAGEVRFAFYVVDPPQLEPAPAVQP